MNQHTALPMPARFWAKVERGLDCWLWRGSRQGDGYGHFRMGGLVHKAHRIAWEIAYGPVPSGLWVLHHCDNPPCVNPAHLFLGTGADNARDMTAKGRHHDIAGARHPMAKLAAGQVRAIRARWRSGMARALGVEYGVGCHCIYDVVAGRTWAASMGDEDGEG